VCIYIYMHQVSDVESVYMYAYTHQYIYTYIHQVLDVESVAEEDQEMIYMYISGGRC